MKGKSVVFVYAIESFALCWLYQTPFPSAGEANPFIYILLVSDSSPLHNRFVRALVLGASESTLIQAAEDISSQSKVSPEAQ